MIFSATWWRRTAASAVSILLFCGIRLWGAPTAQAPITRIHQLNTWAEGKSPQVRPVRLSGVVLCYEPAWGQLYIHDGTDSGYFSPRDFQVQLAVGQRVEIIGLSVFDGSQSALTNAAIRILGPGTVPAARAIPLSGLTNTIGQWVEIEGAVHIAETSRERLGLLLRDGEQKCIIYVLGGIKPGVSQQPRLGSRVRVRGINASKLVNGRLQEARLFAPGMDEVKVIESPGQDLWDLPVVSIDSLVNRELGSWTNRPVRINGLISAYSPGESLVVKDPTGALRAQVIQVTRASVGQRVDVWGLLSVSATEPVLQDAYFQIVSSMTTRTASPGMAPRSTSASAPPANARVLTQVSEIMKLSKEEVASKLPVRLRGTITCADSVWHSVFFQDSTRGIYIDTAQENIRAGQWVEVVAQTDPGGFAPQLNNAVITVLGTTNLPTPVRVTLEELASGHLDAHWIEMDGVVRKVSKEEGRVTIDLMSRKGRFDAIVTDFNDHPAPKHLIDALVSIRGACGAELNPRGQLSGIILHAPGMDQINVLEGVSTNPFAIPSTPIETVAKFDPDRLARRRVKVTGMVTHVAADGFFVQNGQAGMWVTPQDTNQVHIGDWLDILGFPAMRDFSPSLEEAVFRQGPAGANPVTEKTTAERILLHGTYDATLVQVRAELLQNVPASANPKLVLQDGPIIFTAQMSGGDPQARLPLLRPGSVLRVSGVCAIQAGEKREPGSFRLLLCDPSDVVVVKAASWWTTRNAALVAGGMLAAIGGALAWVSLLRSRVRQRTEKLHNEINERKQIEEALRQSEERVRQQLAELEAIYATTPLGLCVLDTELRFRRVNQHLAKMNGLSVRENIGCTLQEVAPSLAQQAEEALRRVLETGQAMHSEFRGETRAQPGVERIWDETWYPLRDSAAKIVAVGVVAEEITARKQAEEQLRASLSEKEILLKEIHHRVKNNIQVISSLLSLQIESRNDPALRTVLSDVRDRVKSMALVHEQLYSSANLAQVDLAQYARRLMQDLFSAHGAMASKISLRLEAESVNVGVDVAVPFGLILNELATNALKHAFVGRDRGEIVIAIHTGAHGEIRLRFADNGVGLPLGLPGKKPRSLGLRLVQMLTDQLSGTLGVQSADGTEICLGISNSSRTD